MLTNYHYLICLQDGYLPINIVTFSIKRICVQYKFPRDKFNWIAKPKMVSSIASSKRTAGWNAGMKYRYLDVRLTVSGGLFQIKGQPEGLHDVLMRIETQRLQSPLLRSDVLIVAATSLPLACGLKTARVVSSRNVQTPVHSSLAMSSRHPGIGYICSTSRAMLIGITSQLRFCSHSPVSTSKKLGRMKKTARPGNACK